MSDQQKIDRSSHGLVLLKRDDGIELHIIVGPVMVDLRIQHQQSTIAEMACYRSEISVAEYGSPSGPRVLLLGSYGHIHVSEDEIVQVQAMLDRVATMADSYAPAPGM